MKLIIAFLTHTTNAIAHGPTLKRNVCDIESYGYTR